MPLIDELSCKKELKSPLVDIFLPIEDFLLRVDREIVERLKTGIPIMDNSSSHIFRRGGKKIRASLVILSSGLKGNIPEDIVNLAGVIEIVHGASLIHDDIIDQALLRRGDLTVSKKWGDRVAVLTGDYMFIKALEVAFHEDFSKHYPEIISVALDMIKGELYQIEYSNIDLMNKEHYYNIIELKTARFMGNCARVGGSKAGMTDEECDNLYEFGLNLGLAFQVVDDTLDYIDDKVSGKDSGNDYFEGKITLPYLYLFEVATETEKELLIECAKSPDRKNWTKVKQKIEKYNAIKYSLGIAEEYISKAKPYLDIFPSSLYRDKLLELADYFIDREF